MNRLLLSVLMLMVLGATVGCGRSDEELRRIVREEIRQELRVGQGRIIIEAAATNVKQELQSQLASLDKLTLSELYIKNKKGRNALILGADEMGDVNLFVVNRNGQVIASLYNGLDDEGALTLYDSRGKPAVNFPTEKGGNLVLYNIYGQIVAVMGSSPFGDGLLGINDRNGQFTFVAP